MKIIVGLGNPGKKYQKNRHNIGHHFADWLIEQLRITTDELKIVKTDVFMNQSGEFIKKLVRDSKSEIENLIIVHDDLDIPLGKFKIQKGEGPRLHNGLNSIEKTLETKDFWRVRIGVDARAPENWTDGEAYVLSDFSREERSLLQKIFPLVYNRLVQRRLI